MFDTPRTSRVDFDRVYEPAEDSFLLLDALEQEKSYINQTFTCPTVLEVGTGSGLVSAFMNTCICPQAFCIATDINPFACEAAINTAVENKAFSTLDSLQASLTDCLRPHSVDILIFNPPYVPSPNVPEFPQDESKLLDLALDGGDKGMEVTDKLLDQLDNVLSPSGLAYIIFCASNEPENVKARLTAKGFSVENVIFRRAGWELLYVFKIQRS